MHMQDRIGGPHLTLKQALVETLRERNGSIATIYRGYRAGPVVVVVVVVVVAFSQMMFVASQGRLVVWPHKHSRLALAVATGLV